MSLNKMDRLSLKKRLLGASLCLGALFSTSDALASTQTITLKWDPVEFATHYKLVEKAESDIQFTEAYLGESNEATLAAHPTGNYQFKVIGCVTDSSSIPEQIICEEAGDYSEPYNLNIVSRIEAQWANITSTQVPDAAGFSQSTAPTNEAVGTMPGQASVSGGQASYSIPINVAPGRNGVQPNVSLNYSSSSGNGLLGVGWSMSTGGSIRRCPSTYAQDGKVRNVLFDENDKLCLDGQRLILVDGTYGENGAEYRTEIESFNKVVQSGSLGAMGATFTVTSKDGSVSEYGVTVDSRIYPNNASVDHGWLINRKTDVTGNNHISFEYQEFGEGEQLIRFIRYTGDGVTDGNRSLEFIYQLREDRSRIYGSDTISIISRRLERINSFVGDVKYWDYRMFYDYSVHSDRTLLSHVEFRGKNNQKMNDTVFDWHDEAAQLELTELTYKDNGMEVAITDPSFKIHTVMPRGDTNGDGVRDWPGVYVDAYGNKVGDNNIELQNCQHVAITRSYTCIQGDFNRDGLTDGWEVVDNKMRLLITKPDSATPDTVSTNVLLESKHISEDFAHIKNVADYNGDGWPDLMVYEHNDWYPQIRYYEHSGNSANPYNSGQVIYQYTMRRPEKGFPFKIYDIQFLGDLDGNGLPDMVITNTYHDRLGFGLPQPYPYKLLLTDYNSSNAVTFAESAIPLPYDIENDDGMFRMFSMFIDVNGDGLQDLLGYYDEVGMLQVMFNAGKGIFKAPMLISGDRTIAVSAYRYYPASGDPSMGSEPVTIRTPKYKDSFKVADINLDGKPELLIPGERLVEGCATYREIGEGDVEKQHEVCGDEIYSTTFKPNYTSNSTSLIDAALLDDSVYQYEAIFFDIAPDATVSARREVTEFVGSATQSAFIDVTGNGLQDFVFAYGKRPGTSSTLDASTATGVMAGLDFGYYVMRNHGAGSAVQPEPHDMLASVTNGLGVTSEWTYRTLSSGSHDDTNDTWEFYKPDFNYTDQFERGNGEYLHFASSMYVVSEFKQDNGVGGQNATEYAYVGAVYNTQGRGFQGFREIHVENVAQQTRSVSAFEQMFPLTGRLTSTSTEVVNKHGNWQTVSESTSHWQVNAAHLAATTAANRHIYSDSNDSYSYDLTDGTLLTNNSASITGIDQYGNVTHQTTTLFDGFSTHSVDVVNAYSPNESNWWLNKIDSTTTTYSDLVRDAATPLKLEAEALDKDRVVTVDYVNYDSDVRKPTQVTTSADDGFLLTKQSGDWLPSGSDIHVVTVNTDYNNYGLPNYIEQVGDVYVKSTNSWQQQKRKTSFNYSKDGATVAADGYFPYQVTNPLSQTITTTTNVGIGKPLTVTDANAMVSSTTYDMFSRPISNTVTGQPIQFMGYQAIDAGDGTAPERAAFKMVTSQAGAPNQTQYFDKFNRVLRTVSVGFNAADNYLMDVSYDNLGRKTFESMPYKAGDASYGTHFNSYDNLNRLLQKTTDQADNTLTTVYVHSGFTTEITAGSLEMSRTYNGNKQLISTIDDLGGSTQYAYDNMGNPVVIKDANGNLITANYNGLGHKLYVDDPNMGQSIFVNNTFGEVEVEQDANGDAIDFIYDSLGRVTSRLTEHAANAALNSTASFVWDANGTNCKQGLLCRESENGMARAYQYDAALRIVQTDVTLDGTDYAIKQQFDSNYGRPKALEYPNGLTIAYQYNARGYLTHEKNAATGYVYRNVTSMDAFGNISNAQMAEDKIESSVLYAPETGQMRSSFAQNQSNETLHHLYYNLYDLYGNLKGYDNHVTGVSEAYVYDDLHRLTSNTASYNGSQITDVSYDYDNIGNFKYKSDYSSSSSNAYLYGNSAKDAGGNAGSNAVRQVTLKDNSIAQFAYDNKGNMTSGDGLAATYFAYGKPHTLTRNNKTSEFAYGSDRARYKQIAEGKTTYYIDKFFEVEGEDWRAYISDAAVIHYTAANVSENQQQDINIRYLLRDRLGSAATLVDDKGRVKERRRFDAFGKPRSTGPDALSSSTLAAFGGDAAITNRGFTDHEHLDDQELIHMNGRVYDYNLGRFMSVDPFLHGGSQGINPYSYIMNNPLAGTDPSGYKPEEETVTVDKDTTAYKDDDGNVYVSAGDGSGDMIKVDSISVTTSSENGSSTTTSTFGEGGKVTEVSTTNIGSQSLVAQQKNLTGNSSQQTSSTGNDSLKRRLGSEMNKAAESNGISIGDYDGPAVNANITDLGYDENGNVNYAQFTCDSSCLADARNAFKAAKFTEYELMHGLIINRYREGSRDAAWIAGGSIAAVYAFTGTVYYGSYTLASMSASQRAAWIALYGESAAVVNGASLPALGDVAAYGAFRFSGALMQQAPRLRRFAEGAFKPILKFRDGKWIIENVKP